MKNLIYVTGINGTQNFITLKAKRVAILFNENKFIITKILYFPEMHGNFILGNNFISEYLLMTINIGSIGLTLNKEMVAIHLLQ